MRANKFMQIGAAAALAAFMAGPVLAQTTHTTTTTTTMHDSKRAEVRTSKLVGSNVYNAQNETVGTVDDILLSHDTKQPVQAVISVGGFLGIGSKLVTVDYDRLKLGADNKVVMPHATKDELKGMQTFSYNSLEHSGTTNASRGSTASDTGTATGAAATSDRMTTPANPAADDHHPLTALGTTLRERLGPGGQPLRPFVASAACMLGGLLRAQAWFDLTGTTGQ